MRDLDITLIDPPAVDLRGRVDSEAIDELAESLAGYDMLNPIIVCTTVSSKRYEIVAGARRMRAAQRARQKTVPAYIYDGLDRAQRIKMALVENVHREDLEPMWEARAYRILQEEGLTEEQIAQAIFKRPSHIRNRLKLLGLAPKVQKMVERGELAVKTAELIAKADQEAQEPLAERIKDSVLDSATLRRMMKNDEIEAQRRRRMERERKRQQKEERARREQEKYKPVPPTQPKPTPPPGKSSGANISGTGPAAPAKPKQPAPPPPPPKKPANPHLLPASHQDDLLKVITRKCEVFVEEFLHGIDLRQFDQRHLRDLRAIIFAVERELNRFGQNISQHQTE